MCVKAFIYQYQGESNKWFTNSEKYFGRINKKGNMIMVKDNLKHWHTIKNMIKMSIDQIIHFKLIEEYTVPNYDEAYFTWYSMPSLNEKDLTLRLIAQGEVVDNSEPTFN